MTRLATADDLLKPSSENESPNRSLRDDTSSDRAEDDPFKAPSETPSAPSKPRSTWDPPLVPERPLAHLVLALPRLPPQPARAFFPAGFSGFSVRSALQSVVSQPPVEMGSLGVRLVGVHEHIARVVRAQVLEPKMGKAANHFRNHLCLALDL
jgi:hypothetical protein